MRNFLRFSLPLWFISCFLLMCSAKISLALDAPSLSARLVQGNVELSWNSVPGAMGDFHIYSKKDGGAFTYLTSRTSGVRVHTHSGLSMGSTYSYYLYASNSQGWSGPSNTVDILVKLDAPSLSLSNVIDGLRLDWSAVPEVATNYHIYRKKDGDAFTYFSSVGPTILTYTDSSVINGSIYSYYVHASNHAGWSPPSNTVTGFLTPDEGPGGKSQPPWQCACPKVGSTTSGGPHGPGAAGPVNVSLGSESYEHGPDITVYNPTGPGVAFQRTGARIKPSVDMAPRGYRQGGFIPMTQ